MKGYDNMLESVSVSSVMNSLVPISRFNKGEACEIFNEVKKTGFKIVLKNNSPACVLIAPKVYEHMLETIEDYYLLLEAEKRMGAARQGDFIPRSKVLDELGISKSDLDHSDTEIE